MKQIELIFLIFLACNVPLVIHGRNVSRAWTGNHTAFNEIPAEKNEIGGGFQST